MLDLRLRYQADFCPILADFWMTLLLPAPHLVPPSVCDNQQAFQSQQIKPKQLTTVLFESMYTANIFRDACVEVGCKMTLYSSTELLRTLCARCGRRIRPAHPWLPTC